MKGRWRARHVPMFRKPTVPRVEKFQAVSPRSTNRNGSETDLFHLPRRNARDVATFLRSPSSGHAIDLFSFGWGHGEISFSLSFSPPTAFLHGYRNRMDEIDASVVAMGGSGSMDRRGDEIEGGYLRACVRRNASTRERGLREKKGGDWTDPSRLGTGWGRRVVPPSKKKESISHELDRTKRSTFSPWLFRFERFSTFTQPFVGRKRRGDPDER